MTGIRLTPLVTMERENPYPAFEMLRRRGPIFWSPTVGAHLVIGLDVAHEALKNPVMGRTDLWAPIFAGRSRGPEAVELFKSTVLFTDPPDHARLRAFMSRAFQPRVIESLRPATEEIVDALLDAMDGSKEVDIVSSFALPMPVEVIAKLLGVPREDWVKCIEWSEVLAPLIDAVIPEDKLNRAIDAGFEFADYIRSLVERRRGSPENDIITVLVRGLEEDGTLSEDELVANMITLFGAGHETVTNLVANTFVLLGQHHEARKQLEAEPETRLTSMIEESLRYEPPVQLAARIATQDTIVGGNPISAGQAVWVLIGAANRDPERFQDAELFDVVREPNPHISFGSGIHFCLGAALSRLEAEIAFSKFFARYPKWKLAERPLELRPTNTLRGYEKVYVELCA